jgi:hypothetical protein
MVIKAGQSLIFSNISQKQSPGTLISAPVGKVYGIITTPNTPTKEIYEKYGKETGIGTIFYKEYNDTTKDDNKIDYNDTESYTPAKPLFPGIQDYPLIGELVLLTDNAPSVDAQNTSTSVSKYYISSINIWNNPQENSPSGEKLGDTFIESKNIRPLLPFEGDRIILGRKGNGIRFGTTVKYYSDLNEWSSVGNDGDPITIITNGYTTPDTGSSSPNVEEINKEMSSIYMTSTQKIPLIPGASIINKYLFFNITPPNNYTNSQIILNSDRVTLNSKRDEVLLFAKTNIELNTDNITNLNSGKRVHINSPIIWLGSDLITGQQPTEPLLLGNKTVKLLTDLMDALAKLGNDLTSVAVPSQGSPLTGVNTAGASLTTKVIELQKLLKGGITSNNNFTI